MLKIRAIIIEKGWLNWCIFWLRRFPYDEGLRIQNVTRPIHPMGVLFFFYFIPMAVVEATRRGN